MVLRFLFQVPKRQNNWLDWCSKSQKNRSFVSDDTVILTAYLQDEILSYSASYFYYISLFLWDLFAHKKGCYHTHVMTIPFYFKWPYSRNTRNTQFESSIDSFCFLFQSLWNYLNTLCLYRQRSYDPHFMISGVFVKNFWRFLSVYIRHMSGWLKRKKEKTYCFNCFFLYCYFINFFNIVTRITVSKQKLLLVSNQRIIILWIKDNIIKSKF